MEPEKTNGNPTFSVEVDGEQSTPTKITLADVFERNNIDSEESLENTTTLKTILDPEETAIEVTWKISTKNVKKASHLIRKRRKLMERVGKVEHQWLNLFEISKPESKEDNND